MERINEIFNLLHYKFHNQIPGPTSKEMLDTAVQIERNEILRDQTNEFIEFGKALIATLDEMRKDLLPPDSPNHP